MAVEFALTEPNYPHGLLDRQRVHDLRTRYSLPPFGFDHTTLRWRVLRPPSLDR